MILDGGSTQRVEDDVKTILSEKILPDGAALKEKPVDTEPSPKRFYSRADRMSDKAIKALSSAVSTAIHSPTYEMDPVLVQKALDLGVEKDVLLKAAKAATGTIKERRLRMRQEQQQQLIVPRTN